MSSSMYIPKSFVTDPPSRQNSYKGEKLDFSNLTRFSQIPIYHSICEIKDRNTGHPRRRLTNIWLMMKENIMIKIIPIKKINFHDRSPPQTRTIKSDLIQSDLDLTKFRRVFLTEYQKETLTGIKKKTGKKQQETNDVICHLLNSQHLRCGCSKNGG